MKRIERAIKNPNLFDKIYERYRRWAYGPDDDYISMLDWNRNRFAFLARNPLVIDADGEKYPADDLIKIGERICAKYYKPNDCEDGKFFFVDMEIAPSRIEYDLA